MRNGIVEYGFRTQDSHAVDVDASLSYHFNQDVSKQYPCVWGLSIYVIATTIQKMMELEDSSTSRDLNLGSSDPEMSQSYIEGSLWKMNAAYCSDADEHAFEHH